MSQQLTCPRCGHRAAVDDGPFCSRCGRYLAPLRWVAEPPGKGLPPLPVPPKPRYAGPPRYRLTPPWGFVPGPWRSALPGPAGPGALPGTRAALGALVPLLWATAVVALIAAGGEAWRYALLLASRTAALPAGVVAASDALVAAAGWVAVLLSGLSGLALVIWTVRATRAAAEQAGVHPARSARAIVAGWLIPGANLSLPGSTLAEIEHAALGRPPGQRPRPTRLLLLWWAMWACGLLFAGFVLVWSLRTGVQARADGVVLHALLDVFAAATAVVTVLLTTQLTRLLGPAQPRRREVLVAVRP